MGKDPSRMSNKLLDQGNKLNNDLDQLEKYLLQRMDPNHKEEFIEPTKTSQKDLNPDTIDTDLDNINYLLSTHTDFINNISKQNNNINSEIESARDGKKFTMKDTDQIISSVQSMMNMIPLNPTAEDIIKAVDDMDDFSLGKMTEIHQPFGKMTEIHQLSGKILQTDDMSGVKPPGETVMKLDPMWQKSITEDIMKRMNALELKLRNDISEIGNNLSKQIASVNIVPTQPVIDQTIIPIQNQMNTPPMDPIPQNQDPNIISNGDIENMPRKSRTTYGKKNNKNKLWEKKEPADKENLDGKFNSLNTTDCIYPDSYQFDDNTSDVLSEISSDDLLDDLSDEKKNNQKVIQSKKSGSKNAHSDSKNNKHTGSKNNKHVVITSSDSIDGKDSDSSKYSDKLDEVFNKLYKRLNSPLINLLIAVIIIRILYSLFGF
jgi:hypothetical protein